MTAESGLQDPSTWLSIDQTAQVVRMNLDFLTEAYKDNDFSFTGSLVNYPSVSPQSITQILTVYSLVCVEKEETEQYSVGDSALTIVVETIELPDNLPSK